MKMKYLTAVGLTVGSLAGVWVFVSGLIGVASFCGFLGWATYFAIGKAKDSVIPAIASNLSGVAWGVLSIWLMGFLPAGQWSLIIVVLAAGCMCWQANLPLLAFIPGTFIGNACFYAANPGLDASAIALVALGLVCGALCGLASDYAAKWLSSKPSTTPSRFAAE